MELTAVNVSKSPGERPLSRAPELVASSRPAFQVPRAPQAPVAEGPAEDLSSLVALARVHNEPAARQLMDSLSPRVLKIVRGHLPGRMSEEDLLQMIFIKVFNHIHQFEGRVPFEHWVSRIAVNTCLSALKAEKSRPEYRWADLSEEQQHVVESLASHSADVDENHGKEAREVIHLLMERLNPAERLVVNLLHLEERSVAEVHEITGWSTPLVKVRAFRARQKLKKWLRQLEKENEKF
ncbi:MAG TPA: sigma-70 family RNA polymerase sigma factor [Candidatus Saccharimonadales bacterium]|nr:sigma-70 family RNA polymerase sigma factor [Candidatus Saccharimonadales bacterium]